MKDLKERLREAGSVSHAPVSHNDARALLDGVAIGRPDYQWMT